MLNQKPKMKNMKTLKVLLGIIALGLGALGAFTTNVFATSYFIEAPSISSPWNNGIIYSVPAGANYDWFVTGEAQIMLGGGGLNVNAYGYNNSSDVGFTAYADSISYQLNVYGSGGYTYLYIGW